MDTIFHPDPQSPPMYLDQPYRKAPSVRIPRQALPLEPVKTIYQNDPNSMFSPKPYRIMRNIRQVSASYYHNAAVDRDGVLWTWGPDVLAREDWDYPPETVPQKVIYEPMRWMENARSASAGTWFTVCVTNDGKLWGWGKNDYGQLGLGDHRDRAEPTFIMDGVKAARAAGMYTLALKEDGSLWGFGYNGSLFGTGCPVYYFTRVLQGDKEFYEDPILLAEHVISFTSGDEMVAIVKEDHTLWMWGTNSGPILFTKKEFDVYGPVLAAEGVKKAVMPKVYAPPCCMIIADNDDLYSAGAMEDGTFVYRRKDLPNGFPVKIMRNVADVSIGYDYSLVLLKDGRLFSGGDNCIGQCGTGRSTGSIRKPRLIFTHVTDIAAGYDHGMAIQENGDLWIWGGDYGIEVPPLE